MDFRQELEALLAAQVPLIHLVTYEEDRILRELAELPGGQRLGIASWDLADGFVTHRQGQPAFPVKDCTTDTLLQHLAEKLPPNHIVVLKDFHHSWAQKRAYIARKLRNMVARLRPQNQYLVFLTPPLAVRSS